MAKPLLKMSPLFAVFFTMYICFAVFCVLNIVTGVFVENSHKLAMQDEDHVIMEELGAKRQQLDEIKKVFEEADKDGDGELDWEEFERQLSKTKMRTYFRKLGVDVDTASPWAIFQLFDFDGDGTVGLDEFLQGFCSLGGPAKQIDLVRMRHEMKKTMANFTSLMQFVADVQMDEECSEVGGILKAVTEDARSSEWSSYSTA